MARSPLKGADAFFIKRRPVLRAVSYAIICIMCIINLSMLSSSWSNAGFMRRNGSFTGAFNLASLLATMVASGLFAAATTMLIRETTKAQPLSRFSLRMTNDQTEKIISCFMVAWWFALSFSASNMLFVFRDDISRCINYKVPRQKHGMTDIKTLQVAATACTVFKGCVVLNWMIWLMWSVRAWRTFTRSNIHFDSTIFREPSISELDMYSIKPVGPPMPINPATFSPRHPGASTAGQHQQQQQQTVDGSVYDDSGSEQTNNESHYRINNGSESLACPNCHHSVYDGRERHQALPQRQAPVYHQAVMYTQNRPTNAGHLQTGIARQQNPVSNCCQTPVVGTATLETEPVAPSSH